MEDRKKKIIILSVLAAVLIIAIVLLSISLIRIIKHGETNKIDNENVIGNETDTNQIENEINEDTNTVENNNENKLIEDEIIEDTPVADPEQEIDKQSIMKEENDKEKALRIVKEDWGKDNSVYFSYEYSENGKHVVYVRDYQTHEVCRYIVDVNNETFEKIM